MCYGSCPKTVSKKARRDVRNEEYIQDIRRAWTNAHFSLQILVKGERKSKVAIDLLGVLMDPREDLMKALSLLPRKVHIHIGLFPHITSEGFGNLGEAHRPRVKNS